MDWRTGSPFFAKCVLHGTLRGTLHICGSVCASHTVEAIGNIQEQSRRLYECIAQSERTEIGPEYFMTARELRVVLSSNFQIGCLGPRDQALRPS